MTKDLPQYSEQDIIVLAQDSFALEGEYYRLVTFLNQTLKDRGLIFGLSKQDDRLALKIYEVISKGGGD